jgi:hypothetical protein
MHAFFQLAAVAPNRQRTFRTVVVLHALMLLSLMVGMSWNRSACSPALFGQIVLTLGILEGAMLVGWRLTQLPKSQALEFLLVSALSPPWVLLSECLVGLTRLAFVTLAGLPILVLMVAQGLLFVEDVPVLLAMPLVFGTVTGLGLTCWAYEPLLIRRWGERFVILGIIVYLVVGVLAAERLADWLRHLPFGWGGVMFAGLRMLHDYNPFGAMLFALENPPAWAWGRLTWVLSLGSCLALALLVRSALRLHGHFHDEHYRPILSQNSTPRAPIGDEPLTWWTVKRVSRYAGRINVWLAGGFGILYAIYTVAEPHWPTWMGRSVFQIFDRLGGLPMIATALTLLAAVPAAFQYGLWDSSAQDRARRLELLLMTGLEGKAYWQAAWAAAWRRGRGYFILALVLWFAAGWAERIAWTQALAGLAAGIILWGLYFALGFRAFSRGSQANQLGAVLTLLLPLATGLLAQTEWRAAAMLLPPGSVYFGATSVPNLWWMLGPLAAGVCTLLLTRQALRHCEAELRRWYNHHTL